MDSRFECMKNTSCLRCGGCCRIRDMPILDEEEDLKLRRRIYDKLGILYIYTMSRYTISLSEEERDVLLRYAKEQDMELKLIPKKIQLVDGKHVVIDWSLDHDICPFYDENEKICIVYESRPLVCKKFPEEHKFDVELRPSDGLGFEEALSSFVQQASGKR